MKHTVHPPINGPNERPFLKQRIGPADGSSLFRCPWPIVTVQLRKASLGPDQAEADRAQAVDSGRITVRNGRMVTLGRQQPVVRREVLHGSFQVNGHASRVVRFKGGPEFQSSETSPSRGIVMTPQAPLEVLVFFDVPQDEIARVADLGLGRLDSALAQCGSDLAACRGLNLRVTSS